MKIPRRLQGLGSLQKHRVVLISLGLVFCSAVALATSMGNLSWLRLDAPELRRRVDMSPEFFHEVGGVASQGRAKCENCTIQSVEYDPSRKDGRRLSITVKGADGKVTVAIVRAHDWQLKPAFLVAQSGYGSAITLFGKLHDKEAEKRRGAVGIVNYHPALDNTVMGLRLLQADLLIIDPDAADLFKDRFGRYILAPGESAPDVKENQKRFKKVNDVAERGDVRFQSYVVGDLEQAITFSVKEGKVEFNAAPYWYAWTDNETSPQYAEAQELDSKLSELRQNVESPADQIEVERLEAEFKAKLSSIPIIKLDALSTQISEAVKSNNGVNPAVYKALTGFLTLTALARELSETSTPGFDETIRHLSESRDVPTVDTPTFARSMYDIL